MKTTLALSRLTVGLGRRRASRPPLPAVQQPFHAFIAYGDIPAAGRAMSAVNDVLRATSRPFALKPMLWPFSQLATPRWREAALAQAAEASVVVFASSTETELSPALEDWVSAFLAQKRGIPALFVALLGRDDGWTISIEESSPQPSVSAGISSPFRDQRLVA